MGVSLLHIRAKKELVIVFLPDKLCNIVEVTGTASSSYLYIVDHTYIACKVHSISDIIKLYIVLYGTQFMNLVVHISIFSISMIHIFKLGIMLFDILYG